MTSPYFISVDPSPAKLRMFFGRREEIQAIADYLRNGDSVLLIGERRMGKTFLLYVIGDVPRKGADFYERLLDRPTGALLAGLHRSTGSYHWAFVDLLGVTTAAGFYFKVLAKLAEEQVGRFVALSPINHQAFANELIEISRDLSRRGQRAVILVDEIEKLLSLNGSDDVLFCLKAVIQQCDAIGFLLAGDIKPHQTTPEFANLKGVLRPIYLAPLDPADARALVQAPMEGRLSFEDPTLGRILELTGAKPNLVQILCGHLCELVASEDTGDAINLTLTEFDRLWESELRDKVFESFDAPLRDFFDGLRGDERDVFLFLAYNPESNEAEIAKRLNIRPAFVRRGLYRLRRAHRIEQTQLGFRISATIVEEFGTRFVPSPICRPSHPVPMIVSEEQCQPIVFTNLKHHVQEITKLTQQWKGVRNQEQIESWLLMFEEDERNVAIQLLRSVKYYKQEKIDELLRVLHGKFIREIQHTLRSVWFFGMGGPSKSGRMLLYHYRTVNGLRESLFQERRMLRAFAAKGIHTLAFVDDFIGTGKQVAAFWHEELKDHRGIDKAQLYCLVLFAFQSGVEYVEAQTPFRVICVESLDERDRVFSAECPVFDSGEERGRAEEICRRHGEVLCPNHPLGYDDSQALIAFEYQTPNNSLPILWSNAKGWNPIFERKS